jgi:predicted PurR-regulated permease PerM
MSGRSGVLRMEANVVALVGIGVLLAMAVLAIFQTAAWAVTALAVGVLIALALDPVVRVIQRRARCSRAIATLSIGVAMMISLAAMVFLLGPTAVDQAGDFADELPATIEDMYSWPLVGARLEQWDAVGRAETFVDELPERFDADAIESFADRALGGVAAAVIVLLTAVAVLLDGEAIVQRVRRTIPADRQERADEVGGIIYRSVARYFAGSIAVALLNGTVVFVVALLLGVPLAPLAGIWAAVTNLIPQIGGFLGGGFLVVLATTQGSLSGLIALVLFLAYQQLENNVIQPTVIGRAINLTPPTTMLAALIGGASAGVPGALVATPLLAAAKSVWLDVHGPSGEPDVAGDGEATAADDSKDD